MVSPPSPRRLVLFLAYLNVFVCLLAVGYAHLQIQAHAYGEAVYDPFADFVPFRLTWLAILVLTSGMAGFGGFFWTRRTRPDRWRAVIIFVVSLAAIAAAVMNFA